MNGPILTGFELRSLPLTQCLRFSAGIIKAREKTLRVFSLARPKKERRRKKNLKRTEERFRCVSPGGRRLINTQYLKFLTLTSVPNITLFTIPGLPVGP